MVLKRRARNRLQKVLDSRTSSCCRRLRLSLIFFAFFCVYVSRIFKLNSAAYTFGWLVENVNTTAAGSATFSEVGVRSTLTPSPASNASLRRMLSESMAVLPEKPCSAKSPATTRWHGTARKNHVGSYTLLQGGFVVRNLLVRSGGR